MLLSFYNEFQTGKSQLKMHNFFLCRLEIDTISFLPDSTELRVTVTIHAIVHSALDCDAIRSLEEQALMWDGHWK